MKLSRWLILLPCLVLPLSSAPAVGPVPTTGQRPNLVFVFSDQQSWDMLGCYGNSQDKTPNLDRLAAQGVRFNHCISNAPICTPYRGLLLSGQHPLKSGAFENDVRMLPVPSTCDGRELAAAILGERDDAVDSVPLFLAPLDFRGVYTRRHTHTFDTSGGTTSLYREMFFSKPDGISWNCLFDREADPAETNNLHASPAHQALRERLHQQTLAWMQRFGDRGTSYEELIRAVFSPEDQEFRRQRNWNAFGGVLRVRPHDLLLSQPKPRD